MYVDVIIFLFHHQEEMLLPANPPTLTLLQALLHSWGKNGRGTSIFVKEAHLKLSCVIQFSFPTTFTPVGIPAWETAPNSVITQASCLLSDEEMFYLNFPMITGG